MRYYNLQSMSKRLAAYWLLILMVGTNIVSVWLQDKTFTPVKKVKAITCGFGTDIGGGVCRGFLTTTGSNQTFTSPADWNNSNNTIEVMGAGGSGAATNGSATTVATGGGAGAYAQITNFSFAQPGTTTATYRVGQGGTSVTRNTAGSTAGNTGGDTWFNAVAFPGVGTDNTKVGAKGGGGGYGGAATQTGGTGGVGANGWGQVRYDGGSGGTASHTSVATGGGGAGGNANNGGAGTASSGVSSATAGGRANGTGATGGNGQSGATNQTGGTGNAGTEYTTYGSGGGGGGARSTNKNTTATGGPGGARGGGGGGALNGSTNTGMTATSGPGADGIIVITYTPLGVPPTISISQPDGVGDNIVIGSTYQVTYNLVDSDSVVTAAFYYDTDNTGLNGTAITGACATAAEGTGATCAWNTTGVTAGTYYVYGITNDGSGQVSAYSGGTITISAVSVSVSITTDGTINYGTVGLGASKSSINLVDTQVIKNTGNVAEDFQIKTSNATGGTTWTLGANAGNNIFVHEFSTGGELAFVSFTQADSYQSLISNVASNATVNLDLKVTVPTTSSDFQQKTISVTILAAQNGG